ncbi:hypothetical protein [Pseudorhodoferax sp. Leaf265]|uniref:hypothetical protein n=1 Tax=Pseudorhodoferax sp. Leaf265 TaxID=1736315 RepID=UPI0006F9D309|nr:hypothetical protein [Pseudorhodoferax sp. Leaf265]KQP05333.1 hypothetical protein ASF45_12525 [Pseudorhodoferax sp. Leaf265]PZP92023.1 MAG: hypothetical protein DI583_33025 [Variovorax paradoxus]PZQ02218.1 MAG: hypothetical protein DI587_33025 [Variovorax paradoxus]
METAIPWQVAAFWALLTTLGVWAWVPAHWHAAARTTLAGRALFVAFALLTVAVYASMLT